MIAVEITGQTVMAWSEGKMESGGLGTDKQMTGDGDIQIRDPGTSNFGLLTRALDEEVATRETETPERKARLTALPQHHSRHFTSPKQQIALCSA